MEALKIYFAGDLFNSKDIGGNLMLAKTIDDVSQHRYLTMLPQDGECEVVDRTSQAIRDADFELLLNCDVIVANFDGTDLDSGTVVEFCFAKMMDMPAVLLRTDFRDCGDNDLPDGEPWNLMCSHYPRTAVCCMNAMQIYHQCKANFPDKLLDRYYSIIAAGVVSALDTVTAQPSWLKSGELLSQYERIIKSVGGSMAERFPAPALQKLAVRKQQSRLYGKI